MSLWTVWLLAVALLSPVAARAGSRTVELSCVNKAGENMYRAADGSVVWTDSCGHEARCADAIVHFGSTPNSRVILWVGGGACHVVNAALARGSSSSDGALSASRSRKPRIRRRS